MQVIENQVAEGKTIVLDDKHFVDCKFTNCKLIYNGGDVQITDGQIVNCHIQFGGPAEKTANFLTSLGILPRLGGLKVGPSDPPKKPDGIQ